MADALTIGLGMAAGLGLAAASGLRVFLPAFAAGLAIRFLDVPAQEGFHWLGSTPALLGLGTATVVEIGAYYVPWLDNLLDTVATPAAVLAGILTSAALFVGLDPFLQWTCALVAGGGVAGTVQSATVVTRALSSGTTGGVANVLVSTLENVLAVVLAALSILAPALAGVAVLAAIVVAARRVRLGRRRRRERQEAVAR
ncbi:MAG: DUF4126 domain-containing protein [Sandaracinaceae bacterium]